MVMAGGRVSPYPEETDPLDPMTGTSIEPDSGPLVGPVSGPGDTGPGFPDTTPSPINFPAEGTVVPPPSEPEPAPAPEVAADPGVGNAEASMAPIPFAPISLPPSLSGVALGGVGPMGASMGTGSPLRKLAPQPRKPRARFGQGSPITTAPGLSEEDRIQMIRSRLGI